MKAILLCGGIGKRMFPITEDKLLLNFLGKPLLSHQIEKLKEAGLHDLVVVANPQNVDSIEGISRRELPAFAPSSWSRRRPWASPTLWRLLNVS